MQLKCFKFVQLKLQNAQVICLERYRSDSQEFIKRTFKMFRHAFFPNVSNMLISKIRESPKVIFPQIRSHFGTSFWLELCLVLCLSSALGSEQYSRLRLQLLLAAGDDTLSSGCLAAVSVLPATCDRLGHRRPSWMCS